MFFQYFSSIKYILWNNDTEVTHEQFIDDEDLGEQELHVVF